MNPQNGIIGDDYGTSLPEMVLPQEQLVAEKKMARFSRSAAYKELEEYLNKRIEFYQTYLPDGREVVNAPDPSNWVIANTIVREFKAIITTYQQARTAVEEATKTNV